MIQSVSLIRCFVVELNTKIRKKDFINHYYFTIKNAYIANTRIHDKLNSLNKLLYLF